MPSIYFPDFIAANQSDRADNVLTGTKREQMDVIRGNIRDFKAREGLEKVIVLWTANTERFSEIIPGVNDTPENLLAAIDAGHSEVSPSTIFAVAAILEGCSYINGSPQNTFVPGAMELAIRNRVYIGGDDFKSGQTKMKSVLVDFLVSAGIKPVSIASYNHLGNNDGKNLSAPQQFRSKEISKSNVVDDMVASNRILFKEDEHPDHTVVIKYMPFVGDSKRAMDEYMSEIFLGGTNTIAMHNTCEDSLLAAPLIIDLVLLTEICERIHIQVCGRGVSVLAQTLLLSTLVFFLSQFFFRWHRVVLPWDASGTPESLALPAGVLLACGRMGCSGDGGAVLAGSAMWGRRQLQLGRSGFCWMLDFPLVIVWLRTHLRHLIGPLLLLAACGHRRGACPLPLGAVAAVVPVQGAAGAVWRARDQRAVQAA